MIVGQARGTLLAERCRCCELYDIETIRDFFFKSDVAQAVWKCFGSIFRLPYISQFVSHAPFTWMSKIGPLSHFELCRASVTTLVFWEIWVARCTSNFEGTNMRARDICQRVIGQVQLISVSFTPKKLSSMIQNNIMGIMGDQEESHAIQTWSLVSVGATTLKLFYIECRWFC